MAARRLGWGALPLGWAISLAACAAQPAPAGPSLVGNWMGKFETTTGRGVSFQLALWKTASDHWAGVSFYGGDCKAYLSEKAVEAGRVQMQEDLVGGPDCRPGSASLSIGDMPNPYTLMEWRDPASGKPVKALLRHSPVMDPRLKPLIDAYQSDERAAQAAIAARAGGLAQAESRGQAAEARLRALDAQARVAEFPSAQLIGNWRGIIYDQRGESPAELALWSAKLWGLNQVSGYLAPSDPFCATWVIVNRAGERNTLSTSTNEMRPGTPRCDLARHANATVRVEGTFELGTDGQSLFVYLERDFAPGTPREPRCLKGLSRPGCFTVGVFRRAPASVELVALARGGVPPAHEATSAEVLSVLAAGAAPGEAMQAAHGGAEAENAGIVARAREAQARAQEASSQRSLADSRATRAVQTTGATGGGASPGQHGPFDALEGGPFLNTIYNGDFEEARRLDIAFGKATVGKLATPKTPLDKLLMGAAERESITLRVAVLKAYVMSYGKKYKSCLGPDSETLTVTKTTQGSTHYDNYKGYAVERRVAGSSGSQDYEVNKEFVPVLRSIYNKNDDAALTFVGLMAGNLQVARVSNGIYAMMDRYACDSPTIKTMEQRLLELHAKLFKR